VTGTTAVHLCFGYAAIIHDRPAGYSFLPELADCSCDQISIETAQSVLDCSVLSALDGKTIILGVLDLNDTAVETAETVAGGSGGRCRTYRRAAGARTGLRDEVPARDAAFGKLTALTAAAARLRAEITA